MSSLDAAAWLQAWALCINRQDYAGGRNLFDNTVQSFGTFADHVQGIDQLVADQWREIWPYIADFQFQSDSASVMTSAEGDVATISTLWRSLGLAADGTRFLRRGRATIVLRRSDGGELKAVHTHFSLSEGHNARDDQPARPDTLQERD